MDSEAKRLMNKTEAADYIGVTRHTLTNWQRKNFGPRFFPTPGGRYYTTRAECDRLLAQSTTP